MKSFLTIVCAIGLSLLAVFAIPSQKQTPIIEQKNTLQKVLEKGVLRCGYASFSPMLIIDSNTKQISGIAHDVMEEVGKKLGVKIEWAEESGWGEFITALNQNRFDMFCTGNWANSKRARMITFTNPIAYSPLDLFVRENDMRFDDAIEKINDPSVKLVNVEGGTSVLVIAEDFPKAQHYEISELAPIANLFIEVDSNKADGAIMDRATGFNFMKNSPGKVKRAQGAPIRIFSNVFSLRQGDIELQQAVNHVLAELNSAGITEKIIQKYEPLPGAYYRVAPGYFEK